MQDEQTPPTAPAPDADGFHYDLFVIGAGSGGVRAARIAAGHGARVGVAEEHRVGGTCVIRGCVPKKLLVEGAHFAQLLAEAPRFGWQPGEPTFDWPTLRDHVLAEVDRLNRAYRSALDSHEVALWHARATVTGEQQVEVAGHRFRVRHVLVATGARPFVPPVPGADLGITSNEMFHLDALPRHAAIVGGGYIATEFAGILHELGAEVTMIVRSEQLLRGWEPALVDRLLKLSLERGIQFRFNDEVRELARTDAGALRLGCGRGAMEADLLLWATGRQPDSEGLGLEALGLALGERGEIPVDDASATTLPWLHAVGDVTDRLQLTPIAIREGHALADTLFGDRPWTVDHGCVPSAVFSHPPLASVGMTEPQAREALGGVEVYTADFRPMRTVLADREERSLYKLVVDSATDRIAGAHMIGPHAPEILQALAVAVKAGLTKAQLDATVALHPTMAEELVLMR